MTPPKVTAITSTHGHGFYSLTALLDDGSLWTTSNGVWLRVELPPPCQRKRERPPVEAAEPRGFHE